MSERSMSSGITFFLPIKVGWFLAILLMAALVLPSAVAAVEVDLSGWRAFRDIRIPQNQPQGLVGVALESTFLENCQPDLRDLRVVSSSGSLVPFTVTEAAAGVETHPFPVRVMNITRSPGKWTDIWIDKTAKVLSRSTLIQTTSKEFVRKVEVRGSDAGRDWYVIRMDGLIADLASPIPVSSLAVSYPLNNFQYLHIRVLDDDQPPLKIEGILCSPPESNSELTRPLDTRILESRTEPNGNTTTTVVDLGEKRFPLVSVTITTPAAEFVKKVRLRGGSSPSPDSWKIIYEGTLFRLRKEETSTENLTAVVKPHTCRYLMMEIYGGSASTVPVEKVSATGGIPVLIFQRSRGLEYRLYYDNPAVSTKGHPYELQAADLAQTESLFKDTSLGPPQKNSIQAAVKPIASPGVGTGFSLRQIAGIALLLTGLLVLFGVVLRRRSSYYAERERNSRFFRSRI